MKTEFGTAKINNKGYYMIMDNSKGNHLKLLHRLIWEENYGQIPKGYVIHHKDENKLNNDLNNLELINRKDHASLHHTGAIRSEETRKKMSGKNHHFYGKHHKKSSKKLISEHRKRNCPTIQKTGFVYGKQNYKLKYKEKILMNSVNKEKLEWIKNSIYFNLKYKVI